MHTKILDVFSEGTQKQFLYSFWFIYAWRTVHSVDNERQCYRARNMCVVVILFSFVAGVPDNSQYAMQISMLDLLRFYRNKKHDWSMEKFLCIRPSQIPTMFVCKQQQCCVRLFFPVNLAFFQVVFMHKTYITNSNTHFVLSLQCLKITLRYLKSSGPKSGTEVEL